MWSERCSCCNGEARSRAQFHKRTPTRYTPLAAPAVAVVRAHVLTLSMDVEEKVSACSFLHAAGEHAVRITHAACSTELRTVRAGGALARNLAFIHTLHATCLRSLRR